MAPSVDRSYRLDKRFSAHNLPEQCLRFGVLAHDMARMTINDDTASVMA